ncbi:PP0621 family protein [Thioalkalivibrio sp.]|uniref:PP0621 family protein n=1 Tax=Thioalkalivibrio sp. TaxID=2093813 RepID=UPI003565DEF7
MRLLLLIAAIVGVFLIVRTLLRSAGRNRPEQPERLKQQGAVVRCAHCGVHVPQLEAYRSGNRMYCSRDHALVDQRDRSEG